MHTVVIRLSSVGDIVLCGFVTGQLKPVTFITSPAYRELALALPGVKKVICPPEDPLPKTATKIIDLHANARSNWISSKIKGPTHRLKRYDLLRRMRVVLKWKKQPPLVIERYAQAAQITISKTPWLNVKKEPTHLILCPFTKHKTKCWPIENYIQIANQWSGKILLLGGKQEEKARQVSDTL